jgi:hypothetical protein
LTKTAFRRYNFSILASFLQIEKEKILSLAKALVKSKEDFSERFLADTSGGMRTELAQYFGMLCNNERQYLWIEIKTTILSHIILIC